MNIKLSTVVTGLISVVILTGCQTPLKSTALNQSIEEPPITLVPNTPDSDGDGVDDPSDALPLDSTETVDTDLDGLGNNLDADDDGDGITDDEDIGPLDRNSPPDFVWGGQNWGAFRWQ